jgi:hypothetical protein
MVTIAWNLLGFHLINTLPKGSTFNGEYYRVNILTELLPLRPQVDRTRWAGDEIPGRRIPDTMPFGEFVGRLPSRSVVVITTSLRELHMVSARDPRRMPLDISGATSIFLRREAIISTRSDGAS